ncbi:MAG: hypothetical protein K0Q75_592, partial [Anaerospora sp.]|nr:hypothetical protein [Anaerospora sp.]
PNTVVKPIYAESTWLETAWEDRKSLIEKSTYECKCFFALYAKREKTPNSKLGFFEGIPV